MHADQKKIGRQLGKALAPISQSSGSSVPLRFKGVPITRDYGDAGDHGDSAVPILRLRTKNYVSLEMMAATSRDGVSREGVVLKSRDFGGYDEEMRRSKGTLYRLRAITAIPAITAIS